MSGYDKTQWFSGALPAISASNLAKIEDGLEAALGVDSKSTVVNGLPDEVSTVFILGVDGGVFHRVQSSIYDDSGTEYCGVFISCGDGTGAGWVRSVIPYYWPLSWFAEPDESNSDSSPALSCILNNNIHRGVLVDGCFYMRTCCDLLPGSSFVGLNSLSGGSSPSMSQLIWVGGQSAMFEMAVTRVTFASLEVKNEGDATDWVAMLEGSQRLFLDNIRMQPATLVNTFSRSAVYCYGHRLGYSKFTRMDVNGIAPDFIYLESSNETETVTTFKLSDSIFFANVRDMNVVRSDVSIEILNVRDNTFGANSPGNKTLTIVKSDSRIKALNCTGNEHGQVSGRVDSLALDVSDVGVFSFTENQVSGGSRADYFGQIQCDSAVVGGNGYNGYPGGLFKIGGDGAYSDYGNVAEDGQSGPVFSGATIKTYVQVGTQVILIDPYAMPGPYKLCYIEMNSLDSPSIRVRSSNAGKMRASAGMVLTVRMLNVTGGSVGKGSFKDTFFTSKGMNVLESDIPSGGYVSYTFIHNGVLFDEISRFVSS